MFNTPILFIIFNRLDTTKEVFSRIQQIKPANLFIAADGPRKDRPGETEKCKEVKEWVLSNINWDCSVQTLFRNENLGCGKNVSNAITWFFDNVEQGIILEDDCLPDLSFFRYCEELLDKYKSDSRVMHIAGFNPLYKSKCKNNASYYFEPIQHCWGWANWARSWKNYCFEIDDNYQTVLNTNKYFLNPNVKASWENILSKMKNHEIDTWDYQWSYKILSMNGLCINPRESLIQNIGLTSGVHFSGNSGNSRTAPAIPINFPLKHPFKHDFDWINVKKIQKLEIPSKKINYKRIFLFVPKWILKKIHLFNFVKKLIKKEN